MAPKKKYLLNKASLPLTLTEMITGDDTNVDDTNVDDPFATWNPVEKKTFVLALYLFDKDFRLMNRMLGYKGIKSLQRTLLLF